MLRVGLTGELGSGKSTVAGMLVARGAIVLSSDEMAREMMQPGQAVYQAIVDHFGSGVVLADGKLDRPALARLAFDASQPRVEELNAIIHPAVLAEQEKRIGAIALADPRAIVVVESALIFSTKHAQGGQPWRNRFDRVLIVTAPDETKIARFQTRVTGSRQFSGVQMSEIRADALARLAAQRIAPGSCPECIILENSADLKRLESRVEEVFQQLRRDALNQELKA